MPRETTAVVSWLRSFAVALLIFAVCLAWVPERGERGEPTLMGDSVSYAAMVEGKTDVPPPFRYRVIVPCVARVLPLPPDRALSWVSWISLLAAYTVVLETARRLGTERRFAALGLALAVFTAPHLYHYWNPFLTDATSILVVAVCVHALVAGRYAVLGFAAVLGVGVREALLVVAPAAATAGRWRAAALTTAAAVSACVVIRSWVGPLTVHDPGPFVRFPARPVGDMLRELLAAWHGLWLLSPIGLSRFATRRRELLGMSAFLLAGTVTTCLLASDTTRMTQPLFPMIALGAASFVREVDRRSRPAMTALVALFVGASVVWEPGRFLAYHPNPDLGRFEHRIAFSLLAFTALTTAALVLQRPTSSGTLSGPRRV